MLLTASHFQHDSSTACLSVADIAGCATWAAGLLAATLAADLLLIYYLPRAQLGVMGDHIVSGEGEPAGGGVVDEVVSAPLFHNEGNDADKGVIESLHGGAKEDGEKQCGRRGRKQPDVWQYLPPDADPLKNNSSMCKHCSIRINHHKKSEAAISHFNRCGTFRHLMNGRDIAERPTFYESNKRAKKAGAPSLASKEARKNSIDGESIVY
jgi:hypothetical protein